MGYYPIQGGVEILLAVSCYRNRRLAPARLSTWFVCRLYDPVKLTTVCLSERVLRSDVALFKQSADSMQRLT